MPLRTNELEIRQQLLDLLSEQLHNSYPDDRSGMVHAFTDVLQRYGAELQRRIEEKALDFAGLQTLRACMTQAGDLMADIIEYGSDAMTGWYFGQPATNNTQHLYGVLCDIAYDLSWVVVGYEDATAAKVPLLN